MASRWTLNIGGVILLALLVFSLFQASWIAAKPSGSIKLIAGKPVDLTRDDNGCVAGMRAGYGAAAASIETRMLQTAVGNQADAIVIKSKLDDGEVRLTRTIDSKCPAEQNRTAAPVTEAMVALSKPEQFIAVNNAEHAKALLAVTPTDGPDRVFFAAREADIAPLSGKPSFSIEKARQCLREYRGSGILGNVPESCKNGTVILTLDDMGYTLWGWPNRFMARMAQNNVRVIVAADVASEGISGLTQLPQYGDIASSYKGYIWIDDIEAMGPSLRR